MAVLHCRGLGCGFVALAAAAFAEEGKEEGAGAAEESN
jgi:hypothetical protein